MAGSWSGSMQTSLQAGTDPGSTASGPSNCVMVITALAQLQLLRTGMDSGSSTCAVFTATCLPTCEAAASPRPQDRALGHTLNHWTSSCDCGKRRVLGCVRSVGALGSVYYGTLQRL